MKKDPLGRESSVFPWHTVPHFCIQEDCEQGPIANLPLSHSSSIWKSQPDSIPAPIFSDSLHGLPFRILIYFLLALSLVPTLLKNQRIWNRFVNFF